MVHLSCVYVIIYIPVKLIISLSVSVILPFLYGHLFKKLYLPSSSCLKMNFSTIAHCGSHTSKENIPPPSKTDALQVQRAKQRKVLGVLSENEHRGRPLSQVNGTDTVERIKFTLTEHSNFNFMWQ